MFPNILPNPTLNISQVFLKTLEISYSNKGTIRREIICAKERQSCFSEKHFRDGCPCIIFRVQFSRKNRFFKFTFETQPARGS